jgi:hypothetical protein
MMQFSKIRELIASGGLATAIAVTGVRADQGQYKGPYPYFSYKIISSDEESAHQNGFYYEASGSDAQRITIEKTRDVVSLTFISKDSSAIAVDELRTKASAGLRWFKSIAGREFAAARNLSVQLLDTTVQDRTVFQDSFFENRLGFDLIIHGVVTGSEFVESIEVVEMSPSGVPDTSQIIFEV